MTINQIFKIGQSSNDQGKMNSRVLWTSLFIATLALAFAIFNIQQSPYGWQNYLLIVFPSLVFVAGLIGAFLAWRGRPLPAMWIALIGSWFLCVSAALLQQNLDWIAVIYFALSSVIIGGWVMPARYRRSVMALALVGMVLVLLLKILNPSFRINITGLDVLGLYAVIALGVDFGLLVLIWLWASGHLRNRIIAVIVAVLLPVLLISSWYTVRAERTELEQVLLGSARSKAMTGATVITKMFEDAIASGALTRDQVFDRNYVDYLKFTPAMDPTFTGDPHTLDKYHTTYDAYTDKNWPTVIDSFLYEEDFLYAVPEDINGYIPTHNTRYATGDGSAANDRTKRIFNDPVGLASSRNTDPILQQVYPRPGTNQILWDVSSPIYVNGEHWGGFRVGIQLAQNEARVQAATVRSLVSSALLIFIVIGFAWILGTYISRPVEKLTSAATQAANGQLDQHIDIPNRDEITTLGEAFNKMVTQLREMISSLEQRVAERTHSLELAAEVGHTVSQVRTLDLMFKDATEIIRSRFDLYYVQVYLTNPSQTTLILQAGTGTVGAQLVSRAHQLPLNTGSINGRAAVEKHSVVVSDTAASATFRPNTLLPDTRSEMAVPLLIGEKVVGVLDLQSRQANALNQDILPAFEALAGQLAIAIQNARFLAEAEQARAEVESQARRQTRTNWADYLDAIHKPEETGFVFEQNRITPITEVEQSQPSTNENALTAPIAVTGETLGNLVVEMEGQSPISRTSELVSSVARQVAQQIESLRLLDSAERYRFEAEQVSRRLTREGWENYIQANADIGMSYIYDLKEVRPFNQDGDQQTEESALSLPLKVGDETVGKLAVVGLRPNDTDAIVLANAVAERLGARIESLRQYDQTQSALSQSEKLFEASRRLSQATDLQELVKATVETLNIPVVNRAILGAFSYNAAGELERMTEIANWWNGTGTEVAAVGTHYSAKTLQSLSVSLSTTPLFFNDTLTDEKMDTGGLQVAKSLNFRSGAVLPLLLGTRQLGILMLQAETSHNFTQEETRLFSALAPQIATVMENRRQYEQAQHQAERESTLNIISQKIQGATTVETVLQIAARELGHALGAPLTIAQLGVKDRHNGDGQ